MIKPRYIDADGTPAVVKLMDDSWIFNMCASARTRSNPGMVSFERHIVFLPAFMWSDLSFAR